MEEEVLPLWKWAQALYLEQETLGCLSHSGQGQHGPWPIKVVPHKLAQLRRHWQKSSSNLVPTNFGGIPKKWRKQNKTSVPAPAVKSSSPFKIVDSSRMPPWVIIIHPCAGGEIPSERPAVDLISKWFQQLHRLGSRKLHKWTENSLQCKKVTQSVWQEKRQM